MLLGFAGTVSGLIKFLKIFGGVQPERPAATIVQAMMAVMCFMFLVFAIKSFVNVRSNREE